MATIRKRDRKWADWTDRRLYRVFNNGSTEDGRPRPPDMIRTMETLN